MTIDVTSKVNDINYPIIIEKNSINEVDKYFNLKEKY